MHTHSHSGFKERTRLDEAVARLRNHVSPHGRTETVPLVDADARTLAERVTAERSVPHYRRAAMDGFAVRAEDTFSASDRSPAVLRESGDGVGAGEATRVHTGSEVPEGADAVVMVEHTEQIGDEVEVFDAVSGGENVAPVGEDVETGRVLFEPGHDLRPSDLGLLRSVGVESVAVQERPSVGVIPTGEELVDADPAPGEVIETNGLTVSRYVERWGGDARYRDVVTDDPDALAGAIERDLDADLIVTTGGSSVGERDLLPDVVSDLGDVFVHGVAIKPGHPVALGNVADTAVIMLPGYPVSCIVNAVQFLRPALKWAAGACVGEFPTTCLPLAGKLRSEPGVRTFARVRVVERNGERTAELVRASGAGVLSSVALADGWVQVPEDHEGFDAGRTVPVEDWEWSA